VHVGTVVDSTGSSGRKVEYNGKEYDYVFDVDIEEGKPPLKLPYNLSENPYDAATRFLGENKLPISYIDEVAKFIIQNTKGATIGQTTEAPSADPLGTEARYRPDQPQQPKYLPHTGYLALTQAKWEPVLRKLKSLNEKQLLAGNKHLALNPNGLSRLEAVLQGVMSGDPKSKPSSAPLDVQRSIYMLLTHWAYVDRLPAVDVLRCLVPYPGSASLSDGEYGNLISIVIRSALDTQDTVSSDISLTDLVKIPDASKLNVNVVMMAIRVIANLFATPEGRKLVTSEATTLVSLLARIAGVEGGAPIGAENMNLQIALTSAAFNFACLAYNERGSVELELIMLLVQVAAAVVRKTADQEVLFRALMTLGMILAAGGDAKDLAKTLDASETVKEAEKKAQEERIKAVVKECEGLLRG
jgi:phospholipase A-2-activating protein